MTDIVSDGIAATPSKICPLPYISKPAPAVGLRSKKILTDVAAKHKLQVADILGRDRFKHFIAARREAILAMHSAGMTHGTIARIIGRERTTIIDYTSPARRALKRIYHAKRWRKRQAELASA